MNVDLVLLDATAQADLVRRKEVKPSELVDVALDQIDRLNPLLNAITVLVDPPVAVDGPFSGVPFVVKDLGVEMAGTIYAEGSRWLMANVSGRDSELVHRYRRAGLVLIGKSNTSEFGGSLTCEPRLSGPARNPWDPARSTGGSSGGSAAAVASGMVPMAHANDLGGSIRYPAAWCGVFGLKPSRGRIPAGPQHGDSVIGSWAEHAVTRSVRDSAALLDAGTGSDSCRFAGAVGSDPGRLRIAVCDTPRWGPQPHGAYRAAVREAGTLLEQLGHVVEESWPKVLDDPEYRPALTTVYRATTARTIDRWARRLGRLPRSDDIEPQTRACWEDGRRISAAELGCARAALRRVAWRAEAFFAQYDAWVTPTLGGPPPPLGALAGSADDPMAGARRAAELLSFDGELANVTGSPAMSIPFGFDADGLPVGLHVLGRVGDEAGLLRLAGQLEAARPWAGIAPTLPSPRPAR